MASQLDGKAVREATRSRLSALVKQHGKPIILAIIQVGDRADSTAYIKQKKLFGESIGVTVRHEQFSETVSEQEVVSVIEKLNKSEEIQGIIVQLPLPETLDAHTIIETILPSKDVDGLTGANLKLLFENRPGLIPATARGVLSLLDFYNIEISGKHVVIIGRSLLVGKPLALSLLSRNATVTVCHRRSGDLIPYTKAADIVVVATGVPGLLTKDHVKEGQVIVDVGINVITSVTEKLVEEIPARKLVGDVDFEAVEKEVAWISPVPGGVGPTTVAALFENVLVAALGQ
jgi:methylenetetrahydrofolate dehydrogenase (NADP+)/methenyltetrahydrofolate cyclohydrolase